MLREAGFCQNSEAIFGIAEANHEPHLLALPPVKHEHRKYVASVVACGPGSDLSTFDARFDENQPGRPGRLFD
jgi:hypothetical protein